MNLEKLKESWRSLDDSIVENKISSKEITRILKTRYHSFLLRIVILELLIFISCLYFVVLISFKFEMFSEIYLRIIASVTLLSLCYVIYSRIIKVRKVYPRSKYDISYNEALKNFSKLKISIIKYYKVNIILGFFLIVMLCILCIKMYNEFDLILSRYFWFSIIPGSFFFMTLFNYWIRNYYLKTINEAKKILHELN